MSKEMMIVFVYDTECCKNEEDDPASAVLYFHPSWVSDHQRLALSGQLMGSTHFLGSVFSAPKILALESGKFSIRRFSKYILAVGTDRNIADWVIEHRADILSSLIRLYHCNFDNISSLSSQSVTNFKEKLYQIFETYLPILQYGGNTFANVPTMQLPKSASNVFLEAIQILQCCQETKGALGGAAFYHNKIVATQISAELTKMLIMTDPFRIKCTAECIDTEFPLPEGVQILQVYISKKEWNRLHKDAINCRTACETNATKKNKRPQLSKSSQPTKEPVFSAMKRDQSIIFSTVPEEDTDQTPPPQPIPVKTKFVERPRSLSLFSTTSDVMFSDKKKVTTPFRSQASVCSTPLADKVIHGNVMSICCNPDEEISVQNTKPTKTPSPERSKKFDGEILKNVLSSMKLQDVVKRSFSMKDLKSKYLSRISRSVSMKYYGIGLKNAVQTPPEDEAKSCDDELPTLRYWNTIADPFYPIFGYDGLPISKSLYNEHVIQDCALLQMEAKTNEDDILDVQPIQNFDSDFKTSPTHENKSVKEPTAEAISSAKLDTSTIGKPEVTKQRRSLSLPLKSLTSDVTSENYDFKSTSIFSPGKRNLGGVQLTPLLSKLTILAMDERSSGIGSRETTPCDFKEFPFIHSDRDMITGTKKFRSESIVPAIAETDDPDEYEKVDLFIYGQQNMVLMMFLEADACQNETLVHDLLQTCSNSLGHLESHLHQCLDPCGGAATDIGVDPYSYMCLDPSWDIVQRGGPWGVSELSIITHLHKNFADIKNLTEIIVRNDDSIIYGYQCGQTELFYQQNSSSNAGLPTPADLMGTVPLKAKRRLERDHAIILL